MNILALDIGIKTGWAVYQEGMGRISGVEMFLFSRGDSPDIRFLRFRSWLIAKVKDDNIQFIIYEKPFLRGGAASDFLKGFMLIIRMTAVEFNISYKGIMGTTLKRFAVGRGRASKEDMILIAKQKYGRVKDDNQADALHLLAYAREYYDTGEITTRN